MQLEGSLRTTLIIRYVEDLEFCEMWKFVSCNQPKVAEIMI
jgi:hypothetical protein